MKKNVLDAIKKKISSINKDLSYCRKNSELLMIWTVIYLISAVIFTNALNKGLLYILASIALIILVTSFISFLTIYYLYNLKKTKKGYFFVTLHKLLNKPIKIFKVS